MLPSAAWDPGNVVSMMPRWCKLGTCPPEAMERIYIHHRRPLEMISSFLFSRPHYFLAAVRSLV